MHTRASGGVATGGLGMLRASTQLSAHTAACDWVCSACAGSACAALLQWAGLAGRCLARALHARLGLACSRLHMPLASILTPATVRPSPPFLSSILQVFLCRMLPASSSAKPHCMKKTRKAHCSIPAREGTAHQGMSWGRENCASAAACDAAHREGKQQEPPAGRVALVGCHLAPGSTVVHTWHPRQTEIASSPNGCRGAAPLGHMLSRHAQQRPSDGQSKGSCKLQPHRRFPPMYSPFTASTHKAGSTARPVPPKL